MVSFCGVKVARGVKLTVHLHTVLRLRTRAAIGVPGGMLSNVPSILCLRMNHLVIQEQVRLG